MIDVMQLFEAEEAKASPIRAAAAARDAQVAIAPTEGICFEIDRSVLKVLLEKAIEVVPTKDMYPVLKNYQFRVRGDKLSVVASNMNMSVIASTGMSVETKVGGVEVLPARKLLEIVRESDSSSRVFIQVTGRTAVVVAGNASWEISLGKGADFPRMPKLTDLELQTADRAEFLRALSTVRYAMHSSREHLMMVEVKGGRFTACDSNRLQQAKVPGLMLDMQIPSGAVDTLIKMLKGSDLQTMKIGEVDNRLLFMVGTDVLLVNKTDAKFPELEGLWLRPALANDQELRVEKNLLAAALKRIRVNVDLEYNAVLLYLNPGSETASGELTIFTCDDDGNSATATVPVNWTGRKRELIVHFRYLRELLSHYLPEECLFKLGEDLKTKKSPVLLVDSDSHSLGIVQQMVGVPARLLKTPGRR